MCVCDVYDVYVTVCNGYSFHSAPLLLMYAHCVHLAASLKDKKDKQKKEANKHGGDDDDFGGSMPAGKFAKNLRRAARDRDARVIGDFLSYFFFLNTHGGNVYGPVTPCMCMDINIYIHICVSYMNMNIYTSVYATYT